VDTHLPEHDQTEWRPALHRAGNGAVPQRSTARDWRAPQFHVISFEGPDPYASAGGIATRVSGLTRALADTGFDTHLWFVGDPDLPGVETQGRLTLHRWCQWISHYHRGGVYEGEEFKREDLAASLPPFLQHALLPHLACGGRAVVLAEEWQTVDALLHLDWLLRGAGMREHVQLIWNANNVFGFDRIDWPRLAQAAQITTVSRYMRYRMWGWGVHATVIPNGLSVDALRPPDRAAVAELRHRLQQRTVLSKVARWDPDKNWLLTIDTVGELRRLGWRPLLIARGGVEPHCREVLAKAAALGLRVVDRPLAANGVHGLLDAVQNLHGIDVISLRSPLAADARPVLFRAAAAVLANSGHEPFGLVGLEAMAAGGLACTGATGEDYAVQGRNAVVLQSQDPREFVAIFHHLRSEPSAERALRRRGRATAAQYAWSEIIPHVLLPRLAAGMPAPAA
jgi:glycosyltransferase involved in cell wall biosynthesis